MTGNYESEFNGQLIQAALSEELDSVAPRRDLWPSVQAGVQRPAPKSQRHWPVTALRTAAVLGALVLGAVILTVPDIQAIKIVHCSEAGEDAGQQDEGTDEEPETIDAYGVFKQGGRITTGRFDDQIPDNNQCCQLCADRKST